MFCRERITYKATADFVWGEILVGANDENLRNRPLKLGLAVELETEPEPKEKSNSAYLFMMRILHYIANLNPENDKADEYPELLNHFEMIYSWIMFIHQDWHDRVLFVTENGKLGYA
jgi:hypothetical protein